MTASTVHTFCRYCLASCGLEVTVEDNRVVKIAADKLKAHPHGLVLGPRQFGRFREALRTPDHKVRAAPAESS